MSKTLYSVGFLFSTDKSEVALIEKKRPEWQSGHWNGIGGHVEEGESHARAMNREFWEETGYTFLEWENYGGIFSPRAEVQLYRGVSEAVNHQLLKTTTDEKVGIFRVDELSQIQLVHNVNILIAAALGDQQFIKLIYD